MHPPPMPLSFCLPADKPAPPPAPAPAQPAAARAPPPVALPLEAVEPGPLAQVGVGLCSAALRGRGTPNASLGLLPPGSVP